MSEIVTSIVGESVAVTTGDSGVDVDAMVSVGTSGGGSVVVGFGDGVAVPVALEVGWAGSVAVCVGVLVAVRVGVFVAVGTGVEVAIPVPRTSTAARHPSGRPDTGPVNMNRT